MSQEEWTEVQIWRSYETISYATVCVELEDVLDGEKLPIKSKVAI